MSLKSIRVLIYIFIQVNWKLVSVHDKSILSIKNEKFKQKKPLNSTKDKQTQAKNKNYYCSYKSSRPDGQPEWSVEVGPVAPSQQQIRNRTKGKRTKSQKRICIIKRKRTKLYLSWSSSVQIRVFRCDWMIIDSDRRKPVERKNERGWEQQLRLERKRQRARMRYRNSNNFRDLIFFICCDLWLFCG